MTLITTEAAARIARNVAEGARNSTAWNYDHAECAASNAVATALDALADAFEAAGTPDPEPYVGASGGRYSAGFLDVAERRDAPVSFDPRPEYAPTEDQR